MQPTLLILAAGMASRYGSMKQIQSFGPGGETIMDFSIYDAIRAGFGKVVFVIREDFETNFKDIFEPKLNGKIKTEYVNQDLTDFTENFLMKLVDQLLIGEYLLVFQHQKPEPFYMLFEQHLLQIRNFLK